MSGTAAAGHFLPYPDAARYVPADSEANRQWTSLLAPGTSVTAWLSKDTFEQVVGFYRAVGREYTPPQAPSAVKLPDGQPVKKTFLIFDGAPDLVTSTQWIMIQHPFIGPVSLTAGAPQSEDVRDVTEIVLTTKSPVPKEQKAQKK
jgi:hypothetical protein